MSRFFQAAVSSLVLTWSTLAASAADEKSPGNCARELLGGDTHRGVVIQVGGADAQFLADLAAVRGDVVQGLDTDPAAVDQANVRLQQLGFYGPATAGRFSGARLPYADRMVNVLVVSDWKRAGAAGLKMEEALRVLAPFGVLYLSAPTPEVAEELTRRGLNPTPVQLGGAPGLKIVQPYPKEMDEWPEFRHDASRAAISSDELIAPMTTLRWLDGPQFNGFSPNLLALSAGGRVFFLLAPNPLRPGEKLRLEARDAFNGARLWYRPVKATWAAADGTRVFTQLEEGGPVVALDAPTGNMVRTFEAAGPGTLYRGTLVVHDSPNTWSAYDPDTGQKLRTFAVEGAPAGNPLLIAEDKLIAAETTAAAPASAPASSPAPVGKIVAFDFATGRRLWATANIGGGDLFCVQRGLLLASARVAGVKGIRGSGQLLLHAYRMADGAPLWSYRSKTKIGGKAAAFYLGDQLWVYDDISPGADGHYQDKTTGDNVTTGYVALDPATGKKIATDLGELKEFGRCGPDYATRQYVLGMDLSMYDLADGRSFSCYFVRGDCNLSSLPANGMLYAYGNECICRPYIGGIAAAAAGPVPDLAELCQASGEALVKGPAYGISAGDNDDPRDWPTHRHDAQRSGSTRVTIHPDLKPAWRVKVGPEITPPVIAGDLALVASIPDHRIIALDLSTGQTRWSYTTGGRIDSPPTCYRGLVLCGSADGWVYCLRASDGQLAWRYRAAPAERRILVRGQLESSWPVHGSVLVEGGVAYVCAGRHADADGGLLLSALDPATGKLLWNKPIVGFGELRSDVNLADVPRRKSWGSAATYNDLLISDGQTLFFGAAGVDLKARQVTCQPAGTALFGSGPTLLGDNTAPRPAWANRSAWLLEGAAWTGDAFRGKHFDKTVWGNVISFDPERVYAVRHDFPNNKTKAECIATVYATANRSAGPPPASEPAGSQPAQLPRLWSHEYKQDHPRLKALTATGNLLLVANQKGGSAINHLDVDAGELLLFNAADGRERGRVDLGCNPLFDGIAVGQGRVLVSTQAGAVLAFEPGASE